MAEMLTRKRKSEHVDVELPPSPSLGVTKRHRNLEQKPKDHLEDLQQHVTVEKSVTDERGTVLILHSPINLLSHCVFCLRKTTSSNVSSTSLSVNLEDVGSNELLEDVPRAPLLESSSSSSPLLLTFNNIWAYLERRKEDGEHVQDPLLLLEESEALPRNTKNSMTFLDLPGMCIFCAEKMQTVHQLLMELRTQLDGIEGIIKNSKYSGKFSRRAEHFERILTTSNLEQGVIAATLEILDKLGRNASNANNETEYEGVEANVSVIFEPTESINIAPESETTRSTYLPTPSQAHASASTEEANSSGTQPGRKSTYVEVPSADSDFSGNFIDEDDDWNAINASDSDPDYIKSEDEDDFSEEDASSSDVEFIEERTLPQTRDNLRTHMITPLRPILPKLYAKDDNEPNSSKTEKRKKSKQGKYSKTGKFKGMGKNMACDLCKEIVPTAEIHQHVLQHVGVEYTFPCPSLKCDRVYSKLPSLFQHLAGRGHSKKCRHSISNLDKILEIGVKCQVCGHLTADRSALRAHLLSVHENSTKNYSCPIEKCVQQFTVMQSVQCHIELHGAFQKCAQCDSTIPFEQMESHLKEEHGVTAEELVKCSQCSAVFSAREHLLDHLIEHKNSVLFCDICDDKLAFSRYNDFREHYGKVHNVGTRFPCERCKYVGWSERGLRVHTSRHLADNDNKNKPKTKLQQLVDSGQVLVTKDPETGEEQFHCRIDGCDLAFQNYRILRDHQIKEHESDQRRHQCDECDQTFVRLQALQKHKLDRHVGELVKGKQMCDMCRKIVPLKDIRAHVREHVGDQYLISCPNPKCANAFSRKFSVYAHLFKAKRCREAISKEENENFLGANRFDCLECGHKAPKPSALRAHLLREHENDAKNFSCPIENCREQFTAKQSAQFHLDVHRTEAPTRENDQLLLSNQKCVQCGSTFQFEEMENHLKEAHGVGAEEIIKCSHCPYVCSAREDLIDHLYEHRSGVLTCDICGDDQVKFTRHVRLREHYFNAHNVGKRYPCEHCSSVCWAQRTWMEHAARCHKKEQSANDDTAIKVREKQTKKEHKCDVCYATHGSVSALRDHKIKMHGAEPYSCKICAATFLIRAQLLSHEKEHAGATFRCEVEGCGKSYTLNCYFKKHMATAHQGERPHVCELCGKSYRNREGLRQHKDAVHLGLCHVCETCGESFTSAKCVKRHMLIHTGERPFGCDICGQRFRQRNVLKTHVEGHRSKGADFKPNGPMKQNRKRVQHKSSSLP